MEVDHAKMTVYGVVGLLMSRGLIEDTTVKEFLTLKNYPLYLQRYGKRNGIEGLSYRYGICERKCWQLVKTKRFKFERRFQ